MRKIFVLLFAAILIFSCSKDKGLTNFKNELTGTWELAGFIGFPGSLNFPPGNGNVLILGTDGSYESKTPDTVLYNGSYSLKRKRDCFQQQTDIILSTDHPLTTIQYVMVKKDSLSLSTPSCYADGGTAFYRRLR